MLLGLQSLGGLYLTTLPPVPVVTSSNANLSLNSLVTIFNTLNTQSVLVNLQFSASASVIVVKAASASLKPQMAVSLANEKTNWPGRDPLWDEYSSRGDIWTYQDPLGD